jgi:RNA polymerase sigma-70 factor (ECF subfamily)
MYSIVHSTWINELRARSVRKRASFEWEDDFLENLPDPVDNGPERQFMCREIIDAIERLPEVQRVVILLVAVEGFTYQQAADVLEIPIGTVMSRLSRARQSIGAMFGGEALEKCTVARRKDSIA